jgi:hypothetical protein
MFFQDDVGPLQNAFYYLTPQQQEEYMKQMSSPEMKKINIISFLVLVGVVIFMVIKFS